MAYKDEATDWKFTIPQEGEVDSSENYRRQMHEIDDALLDPDQKEQLTYRGEQAADVTDPTYVIDEYKTSKAGHPVYATSLHEHPTPKSVPYADEAGYAKEADHALKADEAAKLNPGGSINDKLFTGTEAIVIGPDDIPGLNRVYWGTVEPKDFGGFRATLTPGDLYVRYTE